MSKIVSTIAAAIDNAIKENLDYSEIYDILKTGIDTVSIKVYREDKETPLPKYGKQGDACMDIYATKIEADYNKNRVIVHTGLHFELPEDYEMELRPRSGHTKYRWAILNAPGTLDEGYRGELLVIFTPLNSLADLVGDFPYEEGDRICQLLVRRREYINWLEVENLEDLTTSDRGAGGFGHTGLK